MLLGLSNDGSFAVKWLSAGIQYGADLEVGFFNAKKIRIQGYDPSEEMGVGIRP